MLNANYAISYHKKLQMLVFKHEFFLNSSISPLQSLFDDFRLSLANIILDHYNLSIGRFYYCNFDYIACNAIFYTGDIQYNENITDILFLHEKYRYFINHDPSFLTQANFAYWQNAIKNLDKSAILKMLYEDKKISEHYLLKYSVYNPPSLYELAKSSLFPKMSRKEAIQTEKIDKLPLPQLIKEDLSFNFLR